MKIPCLSRNMFQSSHTYPTILREPTTPAGTGKTWGSWELARGGRPKTSKFACGSSREGAAFQYCLAPAQLYPPPRHPPKGQGQSATAVRLPSPPMIKVCRQTIFAGLASLHLFHCILWDQLKTNLMYFPTAWGENPFYNPRILKTTG